MKSLTASQSCTDEFAAERRSEFICSCSGDTSGIRQDLGDLIKSELLALPQVFTENVYWKCVIYYKV